MNADLLKLSAILFTTGVFLEGVALLFQGIAVSTPTYVGGGLIVSSIRLLALSSIYILSGLIEVLLAAYLYVKLWRPALNYAEFLKGRESAIIIDSALLLLFLAGVEGLFKLNLSGGLGLLISASIFTLILHPGLMQSSGLENDEVFKQSLILSGSIFLAFGGFSSNSIIALVHVGLVSIPVFIYSLISLIKLVRLVPITKEVDLLSSLILEVFIALAVLGGGSADISGIYLAGLNVMATFSAGLYLASGVLGIVTGVLLLITIIAMYSHRQLLKQGKEASTYPPMQI